MSEKLKIGDTVVITKGQEGFFEVGDKAVLKEQDSDGDWWAEFAEERAFFDGDRLLCIEEGISECELSQ